MKHEGDEMVAMAHKYEDSTPELPADWEAIGRLVREKTIASMAAQIESLVLLFDSDTSELGGWQS